MRRTLMLLVLMSLLLPLRSVPAAEKPKAGAPPAALRMEDLEVRGLKEKPEVLYAPAHKGAARPSPVRYDLFLVDMNRAVSPLEIGPQAPPAGGNTIPRSIP